MPSEAASVDVGGPHPEERGGGGSRAGTTDEDESKGGSNRLHVDNNAAEDNEDRPAKRPITAV